MHNERDELVERDEVPCVGGSESKINGLVQGCRRYVDT